ncbi:hypothetical protein [Streptomyces sp. NPDC048650]|uniref:hypothetical protein n=1 Tax=Streptomyces sp. NPDC048650 TaxID=3365583 RepID=UPI0037194293
MAQRRDRNHGSKSMPYGYPHATSEGAAHVTGEFDAYPLDAAQRAAIDRGHAEALFPRLAV